MYLEIRALVVAGLAALALVGIEAGWGWTMKIQRDSARVDVKIEKARADQNEVAYLRLAGLAKKQSAYVLQLGAAEKTAREKARQAAEKSRVMQKDAEARIVALRAHTRAAGTSACEATEKLLLDYQEGRL